MNDKITYEDFVSAVEELRKAPAVPYTVTVDPRIGGWLFVIQRIYLRWELTNAHRAKYGRKIPRNSWFRR